MSGRLALVTGASAGIGASLARIYAAHGYDLAITARRADRLEALAEEIRLKHGCEVLVITADLADPAAPTAILAEIAGHGRTVDALVNNAGYGVPGPYATVDWAVHAAFLQVMTIAVCDLTRQCLPGMIERRFGRILQVASLAGFLPGAAGASLYGATKAFLVRFTQSLHLETQDAGVHVTALCPGFTFSEFHDVNGTRQAIGSRTPSWLWQGADEVAAAGYEAAEANRCICVPGAPNKAIAALTKIIPDEWVLALMSSQRDRFSRV